ncbi:hypothetical protein C8J57DRAFT_1252886 [Mycena rebaudengoi]|nr:hypothetical protein C8J57DRAFT_1252886 [Mycena rebaudengoi]
MPLEPTTHSIACVSSALVSASLETHPTIALEITGGYSSGFRRRLHYDSGPTCDDILRAALPHFPELRTLVVDDITHDERRPDLKLVRERCPAIERVIFDGTI